MIALVLKIREDFNYNKFKILICSLLVIEHLYRNNLHECNSRVGTTTFGLLDEKEKNSWKKDRRDTIKAKI